MTGNYDQEEPSAMFREWIQRSGKAQLDFMRTFGEMMNRTNQSNPLETLKDILENNTNMQTNFLQNVAEAGSKSMYNWLNLSQNLPQFSTWGAFKTSVGSNGRISIPEAERDALGIKEDDLVQVIVVPIHRNIQKQEVKK